MATVSLGNQLFCTPLVASGAPSHLPLLQDVYNPRHGCLRDLLEDRFLISNSESDCNDPNNSPSNSALLALEGFQLLRALGFNLAALLVLVFV